jgi:hypothetical protein
LAKTVSPPAKKGELPASFYEDNPQLSKITRITGDPHLDETATYKKKYEAYGEAFVDWVSQRHVDTELPKSVIKDIIAEKAHNFEKVFACIQPGFNATDDSREFFDGYRLVKSDFITAKKTISNAVNWSLVFDVVSNYIIICYPQRESELKVYCKFIMHLLMKSNSDIYFHTFFHAISFTFFFVLTTISRWWYISQKRGIYKNLYFYLCSTSILHSILDPSF